MNKILNIKYTLWLLLLIIGLTGCEVRQLGDLQEITVPTSVAANSPIVISAITTGGGCEYFGDTEVKINGLLAEIRPYDIYRNGIGICTDIGKRFTHEATLVFSAVGTATVRVIGRNQTIEQTVTVF
jgi:hypothetical protein